MNMGMPQYSASQSFLNHCCVSSTSNSTLYGTLRFCAQHLTLAEILQMQPEADNYELFVPGRSPSTSIAMLVLTSPWLVLPGCWFVSIFPVGAEQSKKTVKYVLPDSLARYLAIARLW